MHRVELCSYKINHAQLREAKDNANWLTIFVIWYAGILFVSAIDKRLWFGIED